MHKMTEDEFKAELEDIRQKRIQREYNRILWSEWFKSFGFAKVETSKAIAIYLFILLNAVIVYSMVAMWVFSDLSYLGVLISDIAAQVVTYAIYCVKAYHGKKQEEFVKMQKESMRLDNAQEDAVG